MRLKLSKYGFGVWTAEIRGHVVHCTSIELSAEHTESLCKLTEPASGDELMRLLDLVHFFVIFGDHFAEVAASPYEVHKETVFTKKKRHGQWLFIIDWSQR